MAPNTKQDGKAKKKKEKPTRFWARVGVAFQTLIPRRKQSEVKVQKIRDRLDENIDVKRNEAARNFYTDILSQYLDSIICSIVVATLFGYILNDFLLMKHTKNKHYFLFVIQGTYVGILLVVIVAFIFSLKERYSVILKDSSKDIDYSTYWLTKNGMRELIECLPRYWSDPEMETAHWINNLLQRMLPLIQSHLDYFVDRFLGFERRLDFIGSLNAITNFTVESVSLGKKVPSITGVHVMQSGTKREIIVIDAEITYDGDIDLKIGGSFLLTAGITRLYFRTKVRLVLGPLFRREPIIGSIGITLLDDPIVDWKFIGILKIGNANWIKTLVSKIVANILKNPRKLTINLARKIPKSEKDIGEPKALLCVDVIEAKDLPRSITNFYCCDVKPDAYCSVNVGSEIRQTPVITFSDNPEWNQTFNFVYDKKTDVELFVKDENFDGDVVIGGVVISWNDIEEMNGREFLIQLRDKDEGFHIFNYQHKASVLAYRITCFNLSAEVTKLKQLTAEGSKTIKTLPVAALSVFIDYATGLETVAPQVETPDIHPVVRMNVGNQFQITSVIERSGSPQWEESHHFLLFTPRSEFIHIEILDLYYVLQKFELPFFQAERQKQNRSELLKLANQGIILGSVTLPVREVLDSPKLKTEGFYQLDGYLENAYIKVLMSVRVIHTSQQIIENFKKPRMKFPEVIELAPDFPKVKTTSKTVPLKTTVTV
ncbi:uncharacterized protein B4U80_12294 [Leptotrombidium deliense]|uniref:Uncharacterized protein n=1 Tax=Leptotrombidium deliense TaxID=299467 RepID=A0A443SSW5_9ACAR|nr:uncharacterized protein B4U80_12294 [Leptotrombidium deliense]